MSIAIIIPARYGSSRFPGKPLAKIAGQTMLSRVVELAQKTAEKYADVVVLVTTEDQSIAEHARELGVGCIMTPKDCPTGSDRVLAALKKSEAAADFIINLQGDAPFTPPVVLHALIEAFQNDRSLEVVTPVHQLGWGDLDRLRHMKGTTPFSGTTAVLDDDGQALWFSKNIIPAIRQEDQLRERDARSPVHQHIGVYGFRSDILEKFCALPLGVYEQLEGLEQLRMLENDIRIQTVKVDIEPGTIQSGIDTPEDLKRAEALLSVQKKR